MTWTLDGLMVESCSCNIMCPCWLPIETAKMDQGWCDSAFLFRIQRGKSDKLDLSGRIVAVAMDFPGPTLANGEGTARVYLDDQANPAQRLELEAIFQGRKGGGMQGLGSLVEKWLPTKSAKISVHEKDGELTATVGDFGQIRSKRLKNKFGRIVKLQNVTLLGASPIDLAPSGSVWRDPEMPRSFRTESGGVGKVSWKEG